MSILNNPLMMRQIIMDNYETPHNKRVVKDPRYLQIHMNSASCIDDIHVYLLIEDGAVKDCAFDGNGCALSIASTSILTELLIGKKLSDVHYIISEYNKMLNGQEYDTDVLEEAVVFANTNKQASRIKCARIGWDGVKQMIDKFEGKE